MPANDYTPFFPSDYRGDPGVEALSYAGRGLWVEMFVLMMMAKPKGYLFYNGRGLRESDITEIARATRGDAKEVRRLLPELKRNQVFSVDSESGVIYSRKLVQIDRKNEQKRAAGKRGGKASAQATAEARALAKSLKQTVQRGAQPQSNPNHTEVVVAGARDLTTGERRGLVRAFCSESLDHAISAGLESAQTDRHLWIDANEEAAQRLVHAHGTELVGARWRKLLDDVKVGNLQRRDDISLRFLLRLWPSIDAHERRAGGAKVAEISADTQSYLDRLNAESGGAA